VQKLGIPSNDIDTTKTCGITAALGLTNPINEYGVGVLFRKRRAEAEAGITRLGAYMVVVSQHTHST
jgi:hypothetical protein